MDNHLGHVSILREDLGDFELGLLAPGRQGAGQLAAQEAAADDGDGLGLPGDVGQLEVVVQTPEEGDLVAELLEFRKSFRSST